MQAQSKGHERRRFQRVGFHADAALKFTIGTIPVEILDISLAGAMIRVASGLSLEPGVDTRLVVNLSDNAQIEMCGRILPHSDGRYAVQRDVSDSGDEFHLRRLLELNLGDPDLVERDIGVMIQDLRHAGET